MKIALDAMGGDHAPAQVVAGAVRALREAYVQPSELVLVGDAATIERELAAQQSPVPAGAIEIVHASENIGMDEHPGHALRKKRDSTIVVGARMVKEKKVGAFVSAGNTGAMVGAGLFFVGPLEGVRRPGIAVTFGTAKGPCTLVDCGANVHCQPEDLFIYGLMAAEAMQGMLGIERPRVGILNIGEEAEKGNELTQRTHELFAASNLNFIGNVEGNVLFEGAADVVVCEGFVGNVVLKVSEGLGHVLTMMFKDEVLRHGGEATGPLLKKVLSSLSTRTDYAEYGGAPLLGVDGLMIICHGRSDARAIANALKASRRFIDADVNRHIVDGLRRMPLARANGSTGAAGGTA
jgi:phosphate acyltransferase